MLNDGVMAAPLVVLVRCSHHQTMADDTTAPLASGTLPPDATPAQISQMNRSSANALIDEYSMVHGGLPAGCPAPAINPEHTVAWLHQHQHSLADDAAQCNRALCLSGGGIRSATFGLGVLQGLAKATQLGRFHYVSSVSGGGYIASWLTGWMRRAGHQTVLKALADSAIVGRLDAAPLPHTRADRPAPMTDRSAAGHGLAQRQPEPDAINHLRAYSNYLSPAVGLSGDMMSLVAIYTRNLFLHWTVLLPLLAALLMLPRLVLVLLPVVGQMPLWMLQMLAAVAVACVVLAVAYMAADLPGAPPPHGREPKNHFRRYNLLPLALASLLFALLSPWLTTPASLAALLAPVQPWWPQTTAAIWGVPAGAVLAWAGLGALAHVVGALLGWLWRRFGRKLQLRPNQRAWLSFGFNVVVGLVGGGVLLLVLAKLALLWPARPHASGLMSAQDQSLVLGRHTAFVVLGPPLTLAVFWLAVTLFAGFTRRLKSEEDREWWARAAGLWLLLALGWLGLASVVLLLPDWLLTLPQALGLPGGAATVGVGTGLLGVLSSALGYWSQNRQKLTGQIQGLVQRLGARALDLLSALFLLLLAALVGLALTAWLHHVDGTSTPLREVLKAHRLAQVNQAMACLPAPAVALPAGCAAAPGLSALDKSVADFRATLHGSSGGWVAGTAGVLALVAWGMAALVGVNTFSLHSMYANRLTRAYLGATNSARRPHWFTGFDPQDNPPLDRRNPEVGPPRPWEPLFPVINTALNLVQASGDRLEWQQRKAASFTFTPLDCGSAVLGYVPTHAYGRADGEGVSIGRAMAISGAAASPNMGYHSSTLVAAVMSFFNVRLGWWMPNTRVESCKKWGHFEPGNGLATLLAETLAGTSAEQDFVYLSDGGHFENLGLYEMVRRRCRHIVVVDATADADFSHDDLQSAVRKIRIDLGVSVEFAHGLPTAESVRRTGQPWALGRVVYRDIDPPDPAHPGRPLPDGHLVYLKPALWDGLPLDVDRYAKSLPKRSSPFPHQTTGDQFFDESQFESYRMLGVLTALKAFGTGDWPTGNGPDHRPLSPTSAPGAAGADAARRTVQQRLALRLSAAA